MQAIRVLTLCCLALVLAAGTARADAKDDAQKALVGKWNISKQEGGVEVSGELEFTKDGKLNMKMKAGGMELKFDGSYKLLSDTEMEVTVNIMGTTQTEKSKFKVSGNTLELTDKRGKTEKLNRVK